MYDIANEYYKWLCQKTQESDNDTSFEAYSRLLIHLFNTPFYAWIEMDLNRSSDGLSLRDKFALEDGTNDIYFAMPEECSVLEMMIALAMRIEHDIMYDIKYGDRTGKWFWLMIDNLGLNAMDDTYYNEKVVDEIVNGFMARTYERDGRGSLFYVRNRSIDMRNLDIWYQMNAYFSENLFYCE